MDMVMKMKYKFGGEQYKEIKIARKQNRDKLIDKRLQVLELRCEGKGLAEIASIREELYRQDIALQVLREKCSCRPYYSRA